MSKRIAWPLALILVCCLSAVPAAAAPSDADRGTSERTMVQFFHSAVAWAHAWVVDGIFGARDIHVDPNGEPSANNGELDRRDIHVDPNGDATRVRGAVGARDIHVDPNGEPVQVGGLDFRDIHVDPNG